MIITTDKPLKGKREDRVTITPVGMVYWYTFLNAGYEDKLEGNYEIHKDSL